MWKVECRIKWNKNNNNKVSDLGISLFFASSFEINRDN